MAFFLRAIASGESGFNASLASLVVLNKYLSIHGYAAKRLEDGMSKASVNRELTFLRSVFYMVHGEPRLTRDGRSRTIPRLAKTWLWRN